MNFVTYLNRRYLKVFALLLVTILLSDVTFGNPLFADEEPAAPAPPFEWAKPTGKISNAFTSYYERFSNFPNTLDRLDLELEQSVSNTIWSAKITPWTWMRSPDPIGGHYSSVRPYFEFKEGWIERSSSNVDVRVGNQIITWGTADIFNPTDQWNARDTVDPINSFKLPQPTGKVNIHPTTLPDYTLEILVTPFFRQSMLPLYLPTSSTVDISKNESRWLIPLPTKLDAGSLKVPLKYRVSDPSYPSTWQAGARLQAMRFGGWDFSVSYQNLIEKIPRMTFNKEGNANDPNLPLTITVLPSFHRTQVFGIDGAGSIDLGKSTALGSRFEIAYNKRNNDRAYAAEERYRGDLVKDDFLHAVLGGDYTFQKKLFGTVIYTNFMYIHYQFIRNANQVQAGKTTVEGLPNVEPFDNNAVIYIESRINQTFKISNALLSSVRNMDAVDTPTFHVQFTDSLKGALSSDFFFGRTTGFYGQFHENNRVNLNASYIF